ncbi:hypothetical protein BpHYR1_034326 [Brachionus plicatilis]|uniref:Uncharacterized protein n=1 Tax=Brachionus plicatilis TaxID=10195 RepID=A0A3M7RUS5_BRAPC|nr:hypothetical protein BpHYR1_034326 [Brachionus plicatilis]
MDFYYFKYSEQKKKLITNSLDKPLAKYHTRTFFQFTKIYQNTFKHNRLEKTKFKFKLILQLDLGTFCKN